MHTWDLSSSSHSESTNLLEDGGKKRLLVNLKFEPTGTKSSRFGLIKQMEEEVTDHSGI